MHRRAIVEPSSQARRLRALLDVRPFVAQADRTVEEHRRHRVVSEVAEPLELHDAPEGSLGEGGLEGVALIAAAAFWRLSNSAWTDAPCSGR